MDQRRGEEMRSGRSATMHNRYAKEQEADIFAAELVEAISYLLRVVKKIQGRSRQTGIV